LLFYFGQTFAAIINYGEKAVFKINAAARFFGQVF